VTYLLDVNALLALGLHEHEFHARLARWVAALGTADGLTTCAITELGRGVPCWRARAPAPRPPTPLPRETEFRPLWHSQTEFGNEGGKEPLT